MNQKIELMAAFLGVTFLPQPFALGSNSINPKLILHDEEVEYRIFFATTKLKYEAIGKVDVFLFGKRTTNLCLRRPDSLFTFIGNLNSKATLTEVVRFLQANGCCLTERALTLLQDETHLPI